MRTRKARRNRNTAVGCLALVVAGTACWVSGLELPHTLTDKAAAKTAGTTAGTTAQVTSVKGTCLFGGKPSTWSAKLTAKGKDTYDAVYVSSWGGKPLEYVGTIKTDLKTEISGTGKASGGRANGSFEFSGKYGADGIAQCSYQEIEGRRSGTLTAEMPK